MSDTASIRSRASAMLNRPQIVPMGPRTRQSRSSLRSSHVPDDVKTLRSSTLDLSEFGGQSSTSSPASMSPTSSRHKSLPQLLEVIEEQASPEVAPAYDQSEGGPAIEIASPSSSHMTGPMETEAEFSQQLVSEPDPLVPDPPNAPNARAFLPTPLHSEFATPVQPDAAIPLQSEVLSPPPPEIPNPPQINDPISHEPDATSSTLSETASFSQPEISSPVPSERPAPARTNSSTSIKVTPLVYNAPKFTPPPPIKFETTPVEYKALSYEAALWTVDSAELQGMVSRAIRSSASTSFIRLLSEENLDRVLPAELERLDTLRAITQSRYRFLVQRRTMLFQALNSTSLGHQKDEDGVSLVSKLTLQLADTVGECDKSLEQLLQITDQIAQINRLTETHWSSALAIALRKLNGSYARRVQDLTTAKERISQLEAELEDAWKEAERVARELDEYETALVADDVEAVIETAEIVSVPKTNPPAHQRRSSIPLTPTLLAVAPLPPSSPKAPLSPLLPVSPSNFVFPPVVHLKAKETDAEDVPDTVSIKSTRSTRSAKSTKSHRSGWSESNTHSSGIQAAKTRSHRKSQSSLHLNIGHGRKQSIGRGRTPHEEQPPVPELPIQFSAFNTIMSAGSANASSTLLHSADGHNTPHRHRRNMSLDSIRTSASRATTAQAQVYRGRAAATDDLYVRMQNSYLHQIGALGPAADIQVVSRTQPTTQNFASIYEQEAFVTPPRLPPKDRSRGIPSMWMNADVPKGQSSVPAPSTSQPHLHSLSPPPSSAFSAGPSSPSNTLPPMSPISFGSGSEVAPSSHSGSTTNRRNSTTKNTYDKIRGLTKRYSVSLPLLFTTSPRTTSRRSG
ncbi:hypothetical protein CVT26_006246 [Gymnopilus dilepis]|uniref:Uncharacterized protein n=1 Tax=Gymnopilus dilepis TaxID=231916 RepID=A0A409VQ03_9AGAR|nr:hypothetical protein CVT26_006246 [Gymnopilus dilepis]